MAQSELIVRILRISLTKTTTDLWNKSSPFCRKWNEHSMAFIFHSQSERICVLVCWLLTHDTCFRVYRLRLHDTWPTHETAFTTVTPIPSYIECDVCTMEIILLEKRSNYLLRGRWTKGKTCSESSLYARRSITCTKKHSQGISFLWKSTAIWMNSKPNNFSPVCLRVAEKIYNTTVNRRSPNFIADHRTSQ